MKNKYHDLGRRAAYEKYAGDFSRLWRKPLSKVNTLYHNFLGETSPAQAKLLQRLQDQAAAAEHYATTKAPRAKGLASESTKAVSDFGDKVERQIGRTQKAVGYGALGAGIGIPAYNMLQDEQPQQQQYYYDPSSGSYVT